jgi:hypothetical protein
MKDPTKELHDAYFTLLNGQVTVNGTEIPVFKWSKPGEETRITIGTTVMDDNSTHDTYILDVQQEVYVQGDLRFSDERATVEDICNEVVQLVVADTLMTMTNFYMMDAWLSSVEVFEEENQDSTVYVKELVFKHTIIES